MILDGGQEALSLLWYKQDNQGAYENVLQKQQRELRVSYGKNAPKSAQLNQFSKGGRTCLTYARNNEQRRAEEERAWQRAENEWQGVAQGFYFQKSTAIF